MVLSSLLVKFEHVLKIFENFEIISLIKSHAIVRERKEIIFEITKEPSLMKMLLHMTIK